MYQTTPTLHIDYTRAVWYEWLRKYLLNKRQYQELLTTYQSQSSFLPADNSAQFWDKKFSEKQQVSPIEAWRIKKVIKLMDGRKNFLNLGVGRGKLEEQLARRWPELDYSGTDITTGTLRQLRKSFPNYKFYQRRLENLKFPDHQFDQVLLMEVIEHIKPTQVFTLLKEVRRVMKRGGRLILTIPLNEHLEVTLPQNSSSHQRIYSERLLMFELNQAGFYVSKSYRASAFKNLFWLKNLINNLFWLKEPNNLILVASKL